MHKKKVSHRITGCGKIMMHDVTPERRQTIPMIEEYLDIITSMDNFADGLMVTDEKGIVVYMRRYRPELIPLEEKYVIGKSIFEVYPGLKKEDSTIFRALEYGETTINRVEEMTAYDGVTRTLMDNTFPIKEKGKIIGAVSIATYPELYKAEINVSSMTSHHHKDLFTLEDIIGRSQSTAHLRAQVERVSRTSSSVLIYGATGTGKELVAQSIHTASKRHGKEFISQNCAAIPNTLLESIFFGTTKGSYTGAENKPGIFELADGGTIFLDEVNSMDLNMQAKLLKVIEEKKVTRIGGSESKTVDVRIIAAINEPPLVCIEEKRMREDLFYRLGSVLLQIEPLANRRDDIPVLAEYYIKQYNTEMDREIRGLSDEVNQVFTLYEWPGNVREFKNVIEGAFNFAEGPLIELEDIPDYVKERCGLQGSRSRDVEGSTFLPLLRPDQSLKEAVDEYEKHILIAMTAQIHNLTKLAGRLGITRQALDQKMKKYGLK